MPKRHNRRNNRNTGTIWDRQLLCDVISEIHIIFYHKRTSIRPMVTWRCFVTYWQTSKNTTCYMNGSISTSYTQMTHSFFLLKIAFCFHYNPYINCSFFGYLYCPKLTCRLSKLAVLFGCCCCCFDSFTYVKGQQQPSVSLCRT